MTPFDSLTAPALPLRLANVDTDQLLPGRFLRKPRSDGYDTYLFHDIRRGPDGALRPDFAANDPRWAGAPILVADRNFGGGSSREGAVYALVDAGIRVVIAPSFGDIFFNNCFQNGMVPIRLDEADVDELFRRATAAAAAGGQYSLRVDLQACTVSDDAGFTRSFAVDPFRRQCLLEGHDDIDLSLRHADKITAWEADRGLPALSG